MKKVMLLFFSCLASHHVNAVLVLEGEAAKQLYCLIPENGSSFLERYFSEAKTTIRNIRVAGDDVKCAYLVNGKYKCHLPGEEGAKKITFKPTSSKKFYEQLKPKGQLKIKLDESTKLSCGARLSADAQVAYRCEISF